MDSSREKRSNAGNRLAELLEIENDIFYRSAYGGFDEADDDSDFRIEQEEESDSSGSDISDNEDDSSEFEEEEDDDVEMRRTRSHTAHKVFKPFLSKKKCKKPVASGDCAKKSADIVPEEFSMILRQPTLFSVKRFIQLDPLRIKNVDEQDESSRDSVEHDQLTQEMLLEEAKQTEVENLRTLQLYKKMQLEKKSRFEPLQKTKVPMIRTCSMSVKCVDQPMLDEHTGEVTGVTLGSCERTFITFPDKFTMDAFMPRKKAHPPRKPKLTSDGTPGFYFDPVTQLPFNCVEEFRLIRHAYETYLYKIYPDDPEIAAFHKWYCQSNK